MMVMRPPQSAGAALLSAEKRGLTNRLAWAIMRKKYGGG